MNKKHFIMKTKTTYINILFALLIVTLGSCKEQKKSLILSAEHTKFDVSSLRIGEDQSTKKVHGQVLYLPVYSNIPNPEMRQTYDMSAFISIHNTDLVNPIKISQVLYFDNDGKLIASFQKNDTILNPLGAVNYYIPTGDKSGTGANFLVEWYADSLVTEPLSESVMVGFTSGQGVSFISQGRIIREIK